MKEQSFCQRIINLLKGSSSSRKEELKPQPQNNFYQSVKNVLKDLNIPYQENNGVITFFNQINSEIKNVRIMIKAYEESYIIKGVYDNFVVQDNRIANMCELLLRLNEQFTPSLFLDYQHKMIFCRHHSYTFSDEISEKEIKEAIFKVNDQLESFGHAIMSVQNGAEPSYQAQLSITSKLIEMGEVDLNGNF
ncbi:MAG: hypothetical protein IJE46_06365 [Clostridia bacterium]|nr:hypothetical protein [Clostridia bacterium]